MKVRVNVSALGRTKWHEYLVRFVFGGLVTALTGWVAKQYGPVVGGLFLAFPAIFPASVTLVQKHEAKKDQEKGGSKAEGKEKGKGEAGVEAAGAALGSIGLLAFGLIVWQLMPRLSLWVCLPLALLAWAVVAVASWYVCRKVKLPTGHLKAVQRRSA
ncbi:MAG TPA: DUF3147 family protein [Chthonomonadaceae bacterium]|nr:DUF3147 family protein [Chthonomonadaceae bacterium]